MWRIHCHCIINEIKRKSFHFCSGLLNNTNSELKMIPGLTEWAALNRCGAEHCGTRHSTDTCCGCWWPLQSAHGPLWLTCLQIIISTRYVSLETTSDYWGIRHHSAQHVIITANKGVIASLRFDFVCVETNLLDFGGDFLFFIVLLQNKNEGQPIHPLTEILQTIGRISVSLRENRAEKSIVFLQFRVKKQFSPNPRFGALKQASSTPVFHHHWPEQKSRNAHLSPCSSAHCSKRRTPWTPLVCETGP